jgi:hypothetical protein
MCPNRGVMASGEGSLWASQRGFLELGEWMANEMVPDIHAPSTERSRYGTYKPMRAY